MHIVLIISVSGIPKIFATAEGGWRTERRPLRPRRIRQKLPANTYKQQTPSGVWKLEDGQQLRDLWSCHFRHKDFSSTLRRRNQTKAKLWSRQENSRVARETASQFRTVICSSKKSLHRITIVKNAVQTKHLLIRFVRMFGCGDIEWGVAFENRFAAYFSCKK